MAVSELEGGFKHPSHDSARAFRVIMNAIARPGTEYSLYGAEPPAPLSIAAGTLLLTLCDGDTGIFLAGAYDCAPVRRWIGFHIGAPIVAREAADFAVGTWQDLGDLDSFAIGTPEYPDRSTTLIVEDAPTSVKATLRGPGIKDTASLELPELSVFQSNRALFPLGRDFYFTRGTQITGLPRSSEVN
jgi:alpha-D-ribose 1-methylphosphonate 5-triphosphate synthase subunit PhnH